jgi:hypothetical protein
MHGELERWSSCWEKDPVALDVGILGCESRSYWLRRDEEGWEGCMARVVTSNARLSEL